MKLETVEIYSEDSNNVVLKLDTRGFPGSLIQGDSLSILVMEIAEAKASIEAGNSDEAREILDFVLERLNERLEIYIKALKAHNLELPFLQSTKKP